MQRDRVQDTTGHGYRTKTTVYEAAEALGITVDAIRKRIQRGTIPHERHEDGRVYVLLDETSTSRDADKDTYRTPQGDLLDSLRDQVRYLRSQLDQERQAHAEARRIIGGLVQRIPELEAPRESPSEARESDVSADAPPPRGDVPRAPQTGTERRPWWRRVFGG